MHVIVLSSLALILTALSWQLVRYAPATISRLLPQPWTFVIGAVVFLLGVWFSFSAAVVSQDGDGVLSGMVQVYVGIWFMLASSAGLRRSESDERYLQRLFGMVGLLMAAIIGSLYLDSNQAQAVLQLLMIVGGCLITLNFLRINDRGG